MPPPRRSIVVIRYPDTVERNMEGMKCFGTHFDESVLHDDPRDVFKLLGVWHTKERHELVGCIQPFTKWCPNGDPKFDMSWLALGLSDQTETYAANPWARYKFPHPEDYRNSLLSPFDCHTSSRDAQEVLTSIDKFHIQPTHPDHKLFMVIRACLRRAASGDFPAAPMIAHQWMIGGRCFLRPDGHALPDYKYVREVLRPARDLIAGVVRMLSNLVDVTVVKLHVVPALFDARLANLQTVWKAWPPIQYSNDNFLPGILPFWQSELMLTCHLYDALLDSFSDHELIQYPLSTSGHHDCMAFYIDATRRWFIIFMRSEDREPSNPLVTVWKLEFSVDGEQYNVHATTQIKMHGVWRWSIELFGECFYPQEPSLICRIPGGLPRTPPFFPLILKLATYEFAKPQVLLRCMSVPDSIREAISAAALAAARC